MLCLTMQTKMKFRLLLLVHISVHAFRFTFSHKTENILCFNTEIRLKLLQTITSLPLKAEITHTIFIKSYILLSVCQKIKLTWIWRLLMIKSVWHINLWVLFVIKYIFLWKNPKNDMLAINGLNIFEIYLFLELMYV